MIYETNCFSPIDSSAPTASDGTTPSPASAPSTLEPNTDNSNNSDTSTSPEPSVDTAVSNISELQIIPTWSPQVALVYLMTPNLQVAQAPQQTLIVPLILILRIFHHLPLLTLLPG